MKKALLAAGCSLFLSSLTFAQTNVNADYFWIDGKTVTVAYASGTAPTSVSNAMLMQVLADIEAKLDGLKIPGLEVAIDTTVRNTCDDREHNKVLVCWGTVSDNLATFAGYNGMDGTTGWRSANVILDRQVAWTRDSLYAWTMHELMHVLGFTHPPGSGTSVLNGAADLTTLDIDGLQTMYAARCVFPYNATDKTVVLPFVTYRGNAYKATVHNDGNNNFSLAAVTMWTSAGPITPCQGLAVDANNELHVPAVNAGGVSIWADLRVQNGGLVLLRSGRN
jgi:hypothetical protein